MAEEVSASGQVHTTVRFLKTSTRFRLSAVEGSFTYACLCPSRPTVTRIHWKRNRLGTKQTCETVTLKS